MTPRIARPGRSVGLATLAVAALVLGACALPPGTAAPTDVPSRPTAAPTAAVATSQPVAPEPPPTETPEPDAELTLQPVVEGLELPVAVAMPDDGTGDLYVVEQAGRILRLPSASGPAEVARHPATRRQRGQRAGPPWPRLPPV
jgi:glucose/arabinose dehydrogenase